MKPVVIALTAAVLAFSSPGLVRADFAYFYIENKANGEAFVPGSNDDVKSLSSSSTGPYSASVSGASGLPGVASYSASINSNLAPDGSVITTSGSFAWALSNAPAGTHINANASTTVNFTVATAQNFVLSGTMTNSQATLMGPDSMITNVFFVNNLGSTSPVAVSVLGTLAPGDYYLTINANQDFTTTANSSAAVSGNFNLTLNTAAVPEPSSLCLTGLAVAAMAGYRLRRKRQSIEPAPTF